MNIIMENNTQYLVSVMVKYLDNPDFLSKYQAVCRTV